MKCLFDRGAVPEAAVLLGHRDEGAVGGRSLAVGGAVEIPEVGVVGEQPTVGPGEKFQYTSGAALPTPSGVMRGHYQFQAASGTLLNDPGATITSTGTTTIGTAAFDNSGTVVLDFPVSVLESRFALTFDGSGSRTAPSSVTQPWPSTYCKFLCAPPPLSFRNEGCAVNFSNS